MLCAVVPLNRSDLVKTRLGLELDQRKRVAFNMVEHVLGSLAGVPEVVRTVVVCPDEEPQALCDRNGARLLRQRSSGLIPALEEGRDWARVRGFSELLVVLGDLPLLQTSELRAFLNTSAQVGLACDRDGRGTNMLYLKKLDPFEFQFGVDSCSRHQEAAARLGLSFELFRSPGSEQDLDDPEHLGLLMCR